MTRMLALHQTPKEESKVSSPMSKVSVLASDFGPGTLDLGLSLVSSPMSKVGVLASDFGPGTLDLGLSLVSSPMSKVGVLASDFGPGTLDLGLSLHANHLLDLGNDLYQIALVSHHRLDVFVSAGNFCQHAYIFAAFNARGLARQIVFR